MSLGFDVRSGRMPVRSHLSCGLFSITFSDAWYSPGAVSISLGYIKKEKKKNKSWVDCSLK